MEKYPRLKFCFAHAGGTAPYICGRWEHGYKWRNEPKSKITRPPSEYFKLLYFDTITHFGPALEYLVKTQGADRIVVGSDYPFDMGPEDPIGFVEETPGISEEDKRKIISETPARLLKLM
jgi:aminocarboxymuconate-semialdehyde decarboxylase